MSDGNQSQPAPNQSTVPPTTDQMIGDATSVLGSFIKDPVGAVRAAWDQKKIVMALLVAAGLVALQLLSSLISGIHYKTKFGTILGNWLRGSIVEIVLLVVIAFVVTLLVRGHSTAGFVGALSGVGAAAVPYLVGFALSVVLLLIKTILSFGIIIWICDIARSALGTPLLLAMFVLLALAVRRKTMDESDYVVARNTVALAVAYFVAGQVLWLIL